MKLIGGYYMLDATGIDLNANKKETVTGIHAKVAKAYATGKPVICYGIVNGTAKVAPVNVTLEPSSTSYVITINATTATIDNADGITIASLIPAHTNSSKTATK